MNATKLELSRLQKYPELFPSKDLENNFWSDVHYMCDNLVEHVIPDGDTREQRYRAYHFECLEYEQNEILPSRDPQRTLWQQYLHNRAPGTGIDVSTFGENGSVQILPMAAIRILLAISDDSKAMIRDIEAVSQFSNTKTIVFIAFEGENDTVY